MGAFLVGVFADKGVGVYLAQVGRARRALVQEGSGACAGGRGNETCGRCGVETVYGISFGRTEGKTVVMACLLQTLEHVLDDSPALLAKFVVLFLGGRLGLGFDLCGYQKEKRIRE
jgi:hypothetical protein